MRQVKLLILGLVLLAALGPVACENEQSELGDDCEEAGRPAGDSSPCDTVHCDFGARCEVQNGKAVCVCPQVCMALYDPVCGSDGHVYGNECEITVHNCKNKTRVQKQDMANCPREM